MGARVESALPGRYVLSWAARDGVGPATARAVVDRLRTTRDGDLQAHVRITVEAGGALYELHQGRLNLHAVRSRRELARALEERVPIAEPVWEQVVEELCAEVIRREQEPSPVVQLERVPLKGPDWLLPGVVLARHFNLWYAPGGSGKSYLLLYLALLVENGVAWRGQEVTARRVLYCDWEVDREAAEERLSELAGPLEARLGRPLRLPLYRRCYAPLRDELPEVAAVVVEHDVGLLLVDSVAPACGGDLMDAAVANDFYRAARRICAPTRATPLAAHHVNKTDRREQGAARLPYGSVYFENLARITWEVRPHQESSASPLEVSFFCRKANVRKPEPFGLSLTWLDDGVHVGQVKAKDDTADGLARETVLDLLAGGPMRFREIVEETGLSVSTASSVLSRLKAAGLVTSLKRGVWAISARGDGK